MRTFSFFLFKIYRNSMHYLLLYSRVCNARYRPKTLRLQKWPIFCLVVFQVSDEIPHVRCSAVNSNSNPNHKPNPNRPVWVRPVWSGAVFRRTVFKSFLCFVASCRLHFRSYLSVCSSLHLVLTDKPTGAEKQNRCERSTGQK